MICFLMTPLLSTEPLLIAGWMLFAVVLLHAGPALLLMPRRTLRRLGERTTAPEEWPAVSVIIAARDEEERVGAALNALLQCDYPALEIVLADDRSTDRTSAIAATLAESDSRLVTIESVPDGWLGKTNAMSRAAAISTGEFLLFTDGDVVFSRESLKLSMRYVVAKRLDHFCLFPSMETHSWSERVLVSFFAMLFAFGTRPWLRQPGTGIGQDARPGRFRSRTGYYGIGAFNLVRRVAYESVGGHEPLRMDILDDVKLGKLLFLNGASGDYLVAGPDVSVRWQNSAWGVICGLEKNAFASMDYSLRKLIGFTLFYSVIFFAPCVAVGQLSGTVVVPFVAELALLHVTLGRLSSAFGGSWLVLPGLIPAAIAVLFAFWRSAVLTLRRGGVRWRETFYRIDQLRDSIF